jgi:hypothetical protein
LAQKYLTKNCFIVLPHCSYSPESVSVDYCFQKLKGLLKGHRFQLAEEVTGKKAMTLKLKTAERLTQKLPAAVQALVETTTKENYFEGGVQ